MTGIVVNMGRFNDGFVPVLQATLPGERVEGWTEELAGRVAAEVADGGTGPDVLATLAIEGESDVAAALLPSVRWVHVLGAGVDGFPLDQLGDRTLTCSKGASSPAIAEFVLASMLAFAKRIPDEWLHDEPAAWNVPAGGELGTLAGATLGLVGVGAIGSEVARRALAFDMRVVAHRRSGAPLPYEGMERAGSLREVLAEADHVVVTAPSTPETRHLIGEESLGWVKPGVHLVNVARGPLVDSDALLAALDDGRVACASLDVAEGEPLAAGHPFYAHPRVRLTPHISHSSPRTAARTLEIFTANLARWRAGEPLDGVVDPALGY